MQVITIAGTIGRDAELRNTGAGDSVAGFSVAVDNGKDKQGNKRDATWFDVSIWGKRGKSVAQYITKGGKITVTGRLTTREHEGKTYLGVNASEFALQGGGQSSGQARQQPKDYDAPTETNPLDDDIPF